MFNPVICLRFILILKSVYNITISAAVVREQKVILPLMERPPLRGACGMRGGNNFSPALAFPKFFSFNVIYVYIFWS